MVFPGAVHYFEDGNLQLQTNKSVVPITIDCPPRAEADVVEQVIIFIQVTLCLLLLHLLGDTFLDLPYCSALLCFNFHLERRVRAAELIGRHVH